MSSAADTAVKTCMGLQKGERVLIVYDKNTVSIAEDLMKSALSVSDKVKAVQISVGEMHGEEPSSDVAEKMGKNDVVFLVTTKSLSHTNARRNACSKGARIASMPGITKEIMERGMTADYAKVAALTEKIFSTIDGQEVRVVTSKGTDIKLKLMKRIKFSKPGLYHDKGDFGNLPSGEADLGVENADGVFIVDASMAGIGIVDGIKVEVADGKAVSIDGDKAGELKKLLDDAGEGAYKIAELGIGTNDKAEISGNVLEDEKVFGTCHIAFGNDTSYGGKNDVKIHLDGVIRNPSIFVGEKQLMDKGKLLI